MKEKYIEEKFPPYFIMGEKEHTVDIVDTHKDVVNNCDKHEAKVLIFERRESTDTIIALAQMCDEVLKRASVEQVDTLIASLAPHHRKRIGQVLNRDLSL